MFKFWGCGSPIIVKREMTKGGKGGQWYRPPRAQVSRREKSGVMKKTRTSIALGFFFEGEGGSWARRGKVKKKQKSAGQEKRMRSRNLLELEGNRIKKKKRGQKTSKTAVEGKRL